jgi:hypothetical protein
VFVYNSVGHDHVTRSTTSSPRSTSLDLFFYPCRGDKDRSHRSQTSRFAKLTWKLLICREPGEKIVGSLVSQNQTRPWSNSLSSFSELSALALEDRRMDIPAEGEEGEANPSPLTLYENAENEIRARKSSIQPLFQRSRSRV